MENNLNYHCLRAAEARFYNRCGKALRFAALLVATVGVFIGAVMLLAGQSLGWFVASAGIWCMPIAIWVKRRLMPLPPAKNPHTINDVLSGEVLGMLPVDLNPQILLKSLLHSSGANFFSARFGLSIPHIIEVTPTDASLVSDVWAESFNIWNNLPVKPETISSAVVVAAIIRLNPATDEILNNLRIDNDAIFAGVVWFEHISQLAKEYNEPRLTGGIARDWSFGYIPTLERFGVNLSTKYSSGNRSIAADIPRIRTVVDDIVRTMSTSARRNIALIGPLGCGKSTIVESFAEKLMDSRAKLPNTVRFNQVFMLDASSILSAVRNRGEVEGLVNRLLAEAHKAKNIILFLDNAELFFEDTTGAIDLSNLLQPVLEGGAIKLILAMDEQRYLKIAQVKPALANALNRIEIEPTNQKDTLYVLEERVIPLEYRSKCTFTYQSLTEAYRLSNRYITDVSQPRASLQLLELPRQLKRHWVLRLVAICLMVMLVRNDKNY